jgi:hypothetical protein
VRTGVAIALRTVAAAWLVVLVSAAAVRLLAASFDPCQPYPGHRSDYGVARARAIRATLPEIVGRPDKDVIVLGSSGVARAFVPSTFDAAFDEDRRRYVSYNLAQLLQQPETALAMAQVIRGEYEAQNKRIAVTIFGISVPELTRGALGAARRRMPDQAFVFSTASGLAERARTDPLGSLGDGLEHLLFGDVRPERLGSWIEDRIAALPPPCESGLKQPPEGKEALAALTSFCTELRAQFPNGVPPWNPRTHGAFDFGLPETRSTLERLVDLQAPPPAPHVEPTSRRAAGPPDLDPAAIDMLARAAHELSVVTDRLFVLRDIMNPAVRDALPQAQLATWREAAERIARANGATLLDFNDGTFTPSDFGDRTHLNPLAAERFSTLLAGRIRPLVRENYASR